MKDTAETWMALALELAAQAARVEEVPVGAVLIDGDGRLLASAHNQVESLADPTAHAEMLVIRQAAAALAQKRLPDAELFVTLEPCPMCAQAISFARLRRVTFGAFDPKGGGVEHGPKIFHQPTCHHRPEVTGGLEQERAGDLLRQFFRARRTAKSAVQS